MNCVLLAEDDIAERIVLKPPIVSTHILLAEDDRGMVSGFTRWHSFYPRPPRGGRPIISRAIDTPINVSTHILLAEDDRGNHNQTDSPNNVSTHILLAEDDESIAAGVKPEVLFLPTSSSRRTT